MNERQHPELQISPEDAQRTLARKTRRGFLVGGIAAVAGIAGYKWVTGTDREDGIPWPERKILDTNAKLSAGLLSDQHRMKQYPPARIGGVKPNGNIGLETPLKRADWRLQVSSDARAHPQTFTLAEIKALPRVEMTTRFCCIEGWSGVSQWAGVRFSDFTDKYLGTGTKVPPYVYLATEEEDYYVGLDQRSALHPQTLLAFEQNGQPLEERRGAPLRLVIPVKYGIKNIKRIGMIKYTNEKPADYWAEDGYDWFAGL